MPIVRRFHHERGPKRRPACASPKNHAISYLTWGTAATWSKKDRRASIHFARDPRLCAVCAFAGTAPGARALVRGGLLFAFVHRIACKQSNISRICMCLRLQSLHMTAL